MNIVEIIKGIADAITLTDVIICLPGIIIFGIWVAKQSFGKTSLADSSPRRHNMPVHMTFAPLLLCYITVPVVILIKDKLFPSLPEWKSVFIDSISLLVGTIAAIAVISLIVKKYFVRGFKNFGLNLKTIHKDFLAAIVNLLCIWPFVLLMFIFTLFLGRLISGPNFQIQQHEELQLITSHSQLSLRILIIVITCLVMPVFEEMLFRGLFQTMVYSVLLKPWGSILITAALFAIIHTNAPHWPALFALGICLGYSYEKSNSLLRPIFIHSIFNTISITAALYSG